MQNLCVCCRESKVQLIKMLWLKHSLPMSIICSSLVTIVPHSLTGKGVKCKHLAWFYDCPLWLDRVFLLG